MLLSKRVGDREIVGLRQHVSQMIARIEEGLGGMTGACDNLANCGVRHQPDPNGSVTTCQGECIDDPAPVRRIDIAMAKAGRRAECPCRAFL